MKKPTVTIEEMENTPIIYLRFKGAYEDFAVAGGGLFNQLFQFAQGQNLLVPGHTKVLTMYNDNPYITIKKNLRTTVAITIPQGVSLEENDEICLSEIGGKFAVGHFEINPKKYVEEFTEAWRYIYKDWLFQSKETPRDANPFEVYVTGPVQNDKDPVLVDIYIPIE